MSIKLLTKFLLWRVRWILNLVLRANFFLKIFLYHDIYVFILALVLFILEQSKNFNKKK
jgi:hypothetical protein